GLCPGGRRCERLQSIVGRFGRRSRASPGAATPRALACTEARGLTGETGFPRVWRGARRAAAGHRAPHVPPQRTPTAAVLTLRLSERPSRVPLAGDLRQQVVSMSIACAGILPALRPEATHQRALGCSPWTIGASSSVSISTALRRYASRGWIRRRRGAWPRRSVRSPTPRG